MAVKTKRAKVTIAPGVCHIATTAPKFAKRIGYFGKVATADGVEYFTGIDRDDAFSRALNYATVVLGFPIDKIFVEDNYGSTIGQ